jgi:hypothetical protein
MTVRCYWAEESLGGFFTGIRGEDEAAIFLDRRGLSAKGAKDREGFGGEGIGRTVRADICEA